MGLPDFQLAEPRHWRVRHALVALVLSAATSLAAAPPTCPAPATVTVFADNQSDDAMVELVVAGDLVDPAATCADGMPSSQTSYTDVHLQCVGTGVVACGTIPSLRPGAWVNRVQVQVSAPGSQPQVQARRAVFVAGSTPAVTNPLVWTVYPRTYTVTQATEADLGAQLDLAKAYTAANPGRSALVTFAIPGGPATIALGQHTCATDDQCPSLADPSPKAGLCFDASHVVVDALDATASPSAVTLSVATRAIPLLRVYGTDDVFRGLTLAGSRTATDAQADTVAFMSTAARNVIERSIVLGPSSGDTVGACGGPDGDGNLVADSQLLYAADRGLKAANGAHVTIEQSCIAENQNGGIQATLGGNVTARENVIQHNVPGRSQNGITVVSRTAERSTLVTQGNVVRFSGAAGIAVTDNGEATLHDDYVADNQIRGSTVDTTVMAPSVDSSPAARFRGVALVCNTHEGITGLCTPPPNGDPQTPCAPDTPAGVCCLGPDGPTDDCRIPCTAATIARDCCTASVDPTCVTQTTCTAQHDPHYGAETFAAAGHGEPAVSYGDPDDAGHNAFTSNGVNGNFRVDGLSTMVPAEGNQWEHCSRGTGSLAPPCDLTLDLSPADAAVDVGTVTDPQATLPFAITAVSPSRPRAGDVVRVYGGVFNAIDGNPVAGHCADALTPCTEEGACADGPCVDGRCPCSIASPEVEDRNERSTATRIRIKQGATVVMNLNIFPDAVTPTMVAFVMPFDCFAPVTLEVAKRDTPTTRALATFPLCDPAGCVGAPAGLPCSDGDTCTTGDQCDGNGQCVPGAVTCTTTTSTSTTTTTSTSTTTTTVASGTTTTTTSRTTTTTRRVATTTSTTRPRVPVTTTTMPCLRACCPLDAALRAPVCGTVPVAVRKPLTSACALVDIASESKRNTAKRLLTRATRLFRQANSASKRTSRGKKPKLSRGCAALLQTSIKGVRGGLGL